jgi:hypothetical protein
MVAFLVRVEDHGRINGSDIPLDAGFSSHEHWRVHAMAGLKTPARRGVAPPAF